MLHIEEAHRLFERFATQPELRGGIKRKIEGVIISNEIHQSFGRTYLRTNIEVVGNFYLYHEDTYVSYRVIDYHDQKLIDECKEIFDEQLQDVVKLNARINELFPDLSVQILISKYDFLRYPNVLSRRYDTYMDDLFLTGTFALQITRPMSENVRNEVKYIEDNFKRLNEHYNKCNGNCEKRIIELTEKDNQEREHRLKVLSLIKEEHEQNKKDWTPNKRLSRLEQRALELKK